MAAATMRDILRGASCATTGILFAAAQCLLPDRELLDSGGQGIMLSAQAAKSIQLPVAS